MNMAAANFVGMSLLKSVLPNRCLPDLHAAGGQVAEFAADDAIRFTAAGKLQTVVADPGKDAALKRAFTDTLSPHCAGHPNRRLRKTAHRNFRSFLGTGLVSLPVEILRKVPFGMRERQTAHDDALDELTGFWTALQTDDLGEHRCDGLEFMQLFPGPRLVVEYSSVAVERPFAWFIQEFKSAFQVIRVARRKFENRAFAKGHQAFFFIHGLDRQA